MTRRQVARRYAGALTEYSNWWLSPTPTPSFLHYYTAHRRSYRLALQMVGCHWGELWPWESKVGVRAVAEATNLLTPRILQGPTPIDSLHLEMLPDEFVLKPDRGDTSAGVFVLKRQGGKYVDLLREQRIISEVEIRRELSTLDLLGRISGDRIIAEEALTDGDGVGIANDFKMYCFQGEIPLIIQIARDKSERDYKYYDGDWRDLGRARWHRPASQHLPKPDLPNALLDAATRVSIALPLPFVRVDLYEWQGQVYLGEATPMPGPNQRFRRNIDVSLGEAWERAIARLHTRSRSLGPQTDAFAR